MEINLNQECLGVIIGALAIGINYFFDYRSKRNKEDPDDNKNQQSSNTNCETNPTVTNPQQQMNLINPVVHNSLCETYRKNMEKEFDIMIRSEILNLKLDLQKYISEEIRRNQNLRTQYDIERIIESYMYSKKHRNK